MTATIVDTHVSEEAARAALAELIAKHGLPEPTEVRWTDYSITWCRGIARLKVACRADVELWAKALRRKARTTQRITECGDGVWSLLWDVEVVRRDWLPGVRLIVDHAEYRTAKSDDQVRAERDALIDSCFKSAFASRRGAAA